MKKFILRVGFSRSIFFQFDKRRNRTEDDTFQFDGAVVWEKRDLEEFKSISPERIPLHSASFACRRHAIDSCACFPFLRKPILWGPLLEEGLVYLRVSILHAFSCPGWSRMCDKRVVEWSRKQMNNSNSSGGTSFVATIPSIRSRSQRNTYRLSSHRAIFGRMTSLEMVRLAFMRRIV